MTYATTYTHPTGRVDVIARGATVAQATRRAKRTHWHLWGDRIRTVEYAHDCECGGVCDLDGQCVVCRCVTRTLPYERAAWVSLEECLEIARATETSEEVA